MNKIYWKGKWCEWPLFVEKLHEISLYVCNENENLFVKIILIPKKRRSLKQKVHALLTNLYCVNLANRTGTAETEAERKLF